MDGRMDGSTRTHTHLYITCYTSYCWRSKCFVDLFKSHVLNVVTVVTKKRCLQGIRYPSTSLRRSTSAVKAPHVLMPMARRGKQKTSGSLVQLLMGAKIWGGLGFNVF